MTPDFATVRSVGVPLGAPFLEHHGILPLETGEQTVRVAAWSDPVDQWALEQLALTLDREIELIPVPESMISEAVATVRRIYGGEAATATELIEGFGGTEPQIHAGDLDNVPLDDALALANEPPVIKLVNMLVVEALEARASDIHMEHYANGLRVRYRIDGLLRDAPSPPATLAAAVVSRLKIMAQLDVAERRVPQDGRMQLRLRARDVDVRVSVLPTLHGESVVLRLLDRDRGRIGLADLGMSETLQRGFQQALSEPNGLVLVTGPTGSGKTTTLYAAIDFIRSGVEKIITVEDPVEYQLQGVPQVSVNERVGLSFPAVLRSLLRQDPDVLMVGEIRDAETAEIAIHAALTGHLVLSTLHTNDSPGAITRLADLGVPNFLIAHTLRAVLAQRLIRRKCPGCSNGTAAQCNACGGTGLRGRIGVYELLPIDDRLRRLIRDESDEESLVREARRYGFLTLSEHAASLAASGVTTTAEAERLQMRNVER